MQSSPEGQKNGSERHCKAGARASQTNEISTIRLDNSPLLIETLTNSSKVPHNERVKSAAQAAVEEA